MSKLPLVLAITVLTGCTVAPPYVPPDIDVPCQWHNDPSPESPMESNEGFIWWQQLNDPLLSSLIERAYYQNLDLQLAASRILQARAEYQGKKGDLYPHVDLSANYDHVYYSKDALVNGLFVDKCRVKRNVNFFELGFDAEWELDLFGRIGHEAASLKALEEASQESFCDIWITLSAEIAKNYIELRGWEQRLILLENQVEAQIKSIQLMDKLFQRGLTNGIELKQAESDLYSLSAQKPLLALEIRRAMHRLSILLGYTPGELDCELAQGDQLPHIPHRRPVGVPSDLLRRRPDIRKAERELAAASEKTSSAIAGLFPRFSLQGFIGDISTNIGKLFTPGAATWVAGPQLLVPIFNSKLLMQDVNYNKIQTQQSILQYQKTVLESLEETENAIAAYQAEGQRHESLLKGVASSEAAVELTHQLLGRGLKDYNDLLIVMKSRYTAEDALIQSHVALLVHYIALYKSLGGGLD